MPKGRRWWGIWGVTVVLAALAASPAASGRARRHTSLVPVIRVYPNVPAGPRLMGLGVEWDPYDTLRPTKADWKLTAARVGYMQPGFIRVMLSAPDYFAGYDAAHNPTYRWTSRHVRQLRRILSFAQRHGISVVLGDWGDPMINGDPRVPADFIAELHDIYGFTDIRYFDPINEPNYQGSCDFRCWTQEMTTLSSEFQRLGLSSWLKLIGPSNGDSWDDTGKAQALDRTVGLDGDNPITDVWVTDALQSVPSLIGGYDSHRYGTIWGIVHGVYENQMRSRREEISNLDSPNKPYFEGELGMAARQVPPFAGNMSRWERQAQAALVDPSMPVSPFGAPAVVSPFGSSAAVSPFVDSQPHIRSFAYGVWMGDAVIQAIDGGLSGASAWDLDDAMHVGGGYGSQRLKQWGFWNSYGGTDGYPASDLNLRPWYYTWSLLSRSFPAGSRALMVPSIDVPGLRVAAARVPYGSGFGFSFAVVNDTSSAQAVKLTVPFVNGRLTLARYDYFKSDRPTDTYGFPVPAQVLPEVALGRGVTIQLPSRGLVILSSLPMGSASAISGGGRTLLDNLTRWGSQYRRSRGLRLDRSNPLDFNGDPSRATPSRKANQYLTYRANGMTNFELKTYGGIQPGLRVYRSSTGKTWAQVSLASTTPAPALRGQGWYLDDLLPSHPLPVGTDQLRIDFINPRTELSQVRIQYGR